MKIRYIGPKNRIRRVGVYTWCKENDFVVEIEDPELVEDLLTNPGNEFEEVVEEGAGLRPTPMKKSKKGSEK